VGRDALYRVENRSVNRLISGSGGCTRSRKRLGADSRDLGFGEGPEIGGKVHLSTVLRETGDSYFVVASKGGAPQHPGWYRNILANPDVEVQVGTAKMKARARMPLGQVRYYKGFGYSLTAMKPSRFRLQYLPVTASFCPRCNNPFLSIRSNISVVGLHVVRYSPISFIRNVLLSPFISVTTPSIVITEFSISS
jgi:hypothetical protein